MTLQEIKDRVKAIADISSNSEYAHIDEDELYEAVLFFIAHGGMQREWMIDAAKVALTTKDIKFERWYA